MRSVLYLQRIGVAGWEERKGDGAGSGDLMLHTRGWRCNCWVVSSHPGIYIRKTCRNDQPEPGGQVSWAGWRADVTEEVYLGPPALPGFLLSTQSRCCWPLEQGSCKCQTLILIRNRTSGNQKHLVFQKKKERERMYHLIRLIGDIDSLKYYWSE